MKETYEYNLQQAIEAHASRLNAKAKEDAATGGEGVKTPQYPSRTVKRKP